MKKRPVAAPKSSLVQSSTPPGVNTDPGIGAVLHHRLGCMEDITLDPGMVAALNGKTTATVGLHMASAISGAQALDAVMRSVGGYWYVDWNGKIILDIVDFGAAVKTLDDRHLHQLQRQVTLPPVWQLKHSFEPTYRVHSQAEIVSRTGAEWHNGTGAPAGSLGSLGDYYLDQTGGDFYEKTGVLSWTLRGNLRGPDGPAGADGDGLITEYSVDGVSGWHSTFTDGDIYMRHKIGEGGTWTNAIRLVGEQGPEGIQGPAGADGQSLYTWIAYADSADGTLNFTNGAPGARTYIGVAYNKTSATESANPADYAWSLIKGADGDQGPQGIQGPAGSDGQSLYTWIAYADSADGTINFTNGAPGSRTYIGLAYNKSAPTESTNPADYAWSRIEGPANFTLVPTGTGVITKSNIIEKITGSSVWGTSGARSEEAHVNGAYVTFKTGSVGHYMLGLNTDPELDSNYTSLDYAWYIHLDGSAYIYESGAPKGGFGSYSPDDTVFSITYDGAYVRYYMDGVLKREVAAPEGLKLYLDAALSAVGTKATNIAFGPQGAVGNEGRYTDFKFYVSATKPGTPSGENPVGWQDVPGAGTTWVSRAIKNGDGSIQADWTAPELYKADYRGVYSAAATYYLGQTVSYQERFFICTSTNSAGITGVAPPASNSSNSVWDLISGKGDSGDPPSAFTASATHNNGQPLNMRTLADSLGYDGQSDVNFTVTVSNSITATSGNAIDTGVWPAAATINLTLNINTGVTIRGAGGNGGSGGGTQAGGNGGPGGHGVILNEDLTLVNNGVISGGSGGGGGGGGARIFSGGEYFFYGGGGGGGGWPNGGGGSGGNAPGSSDGTAGNPGTTSGGGTGGAGASGAGNGGTGGGVSGITPQAGASGQGATYAGGAGGPKGDGIKKNGHILSLSGSGSHSGIGA